MLLLRSLQHLLRCTWLVCWPGVTQHLINKVTHVESLAEHVEAAKVPFLGEQTFFQL